MDATKKSLLALAVIAVNLTAIVPSGACLTCSDTRGCLVDTLCSAYSAGERQEICEASNPWAPCTFYRGSFCIDNTTHPGCGTPSDGDALLICRWKAG
jgi:hypothetical protein